MFDGLTTAQNILFVYNSQHLTANANGYREDALKWLIIFEKYTLVAVLLTACGHQIIN